MNPAIYERTLRDIEAGAFEQKGSGLFLPRQGLVVGGFFETEVIRNGVSLGKHVDPNIVVDEGLNHILDVVIGAGTQDTTWFVGIFEGNYTPVNTDTAANIDTNATECDAYDETTREAWTKDGAASGQSITNSASKATFTMNASKTIYGAFLISDSTKSGTAGVLFAASRFASSRAVVDNDQLLVTYTVQAASA